MAAIEVKARRGRVWKCFRRRPWQTPSSHRLPAKQEEVRLGQDNMPHSAIDWSGRGSKASAGEGIAIAPAAYDMYVRGLVRSIRPLRKAGWQG